ncbi:YdcF family protein, partial [Alloalcanivorax venustensis]|uniref:YdcF family protein n=1 Tax=Alloalcanivorax venustensis TaxID=172371 RepID=UPI003C57FCE5
HIEPNSRSTWENARNTAALLRPLGVKSVVVVTDRAHMPRAILCFQRHGLRVEAVALESLPKPAWAPSAGALSQVPVIWREWAALIWYHLRYFR